MFSEWLCFLLNLLYSTFGESDDNKTNPRNYFSCFGNNDFSINFDKKKIGNRNNEDHIKNMNENQNKLEM